jgi:hypothetical protein
MPSKPIYKMSRGRRLRVWHDLTEINKASKEELRAWLWTNDSNGDYDDQPGESPLSKRDMAYLVVWSLAGSEGQIAPGPKKKWPSWFEEVWIADRRE